MPVRLDYDPSKYILVVGSFELGGYGPSSKIQVEPNADSYERMIGVDGDVVRRRINDLTLNLTVTLLPTADSNDILSNLLTADRLRGAGVVPLLLRDRLGPTTVAARQAWVARPPNIVVERGDSLREWMIHTAKADFRP